MKDIRALLDICIDRDASDLHLGAGEPPVLRLSGRLERLHECGELSAEDTEHLMKTIAPPRSQQEVAERGGADFGFTYPNRGRFRVAVFMQKGTVAINMRLIPFRLLSFDQLGLSAGVQNLLHAPRGLILVTGPTGSGKTTTLATMIDYINKNRDAHIITVEDPIEYFHDAKQSIITQREVKVDVPSFAEGIIKALRQDPDVILVGEMRDLETISAAITAAETGHLVLSTLHTTGSARTVDRITDVFPTEQQEQVRIQLSGNLTAVLSQLLLPRKEGGGRVPAYEIMICTPAIQHMIRDHKTHSIFSAIQTGSQLGMIAMDDYLIQLYKRNAIGRDEMLRVAQKPEEIYEKIGETAPASVIATAQHGKDLLAGARH
jgi:twitching motility protein PilT